MSYEQDMSPDELEQVERYLRNEMDEDEAAAFADRILMDESLSRKVNETRLTILGINEAALRDRLDDYHRGIRHDQPAKRRPFLLPGKWAMAASVAILVALSAWWISQSANPGKKLYSKYYAPDPGLMTLMSSGASNYNFEKAMVEYKNGEYDKALKAWTALLNDSPENDTLLYFTGAALQARGDEAAAIDYLKQVATNSGSVFQKDACWYLGLAYLRTGDKSKAVDNLEKSDHPQKTALLNALN